MFHVMLNKIKPAFLVSAVIIALFLLTLVFYNNPFSKPSIKVDLSRPSVIKEIQSLGNLETASYSIEKIVEAGQSGNALQNLLYGDKLLLIANGKVVAGVDLAKVTDQDVEIRGDTLKVNLPAPTILSSSLDSSKTKVYDRTQGYLNRGDKDLESEARKSAETSITQAACDAGILTEAGDNAITRVRQLFQFAGFTTVIVNIPKGSC